MSENSKQIKIKIQTDNGFEEKDGEIIEFEVIKEPWSEYKLSSGRIIKMKQVAVKIIEMKDMKNADGSPAYTIQSQPIMSVD